jgi:hypothetical protein
LREWTPKTTAVLIEVPSFVSRTFLLFCNDNINPSLKEHLFYQKLKDAWGMLGVNAKQGKYWKSNIIEDVSLNALITYLLSQAIKLKKAA